MVVGENKCKGDLCRFDGTIFPFNISDDLSRQYFFSVGEFVGRFIKIREGFFLSCKRARAAGFNEFFSLSF